MESDGASALKLVPAVLRGGKTYRQQVAGN